MSGDCGVGVMHEERCRPKARRPVKVRAEPADKAMVFDLVAVKVMCHFGQRVKSAVTAVARRNGPVVSRPRCVVDRLKGIGAKSKGRESDRPQSVESGRKETRELRSVVGAMNARGTCRRVALLRCGEVYDMGFSLAM